MCDANNSKEVESDLFFLHTRTNARERQMEKTNLSVVFLATDSCIPFLCVYSYNSTPNKTWEDKKVCACDVVPICQAYKVMLLGETQREQCEGTVRQEISGPNER